MSYVTKCPKCQGDLFLVSGTFTTRIPIYPDGFPTEDAKFFDTENEMVRCANCNYTGPLESND